MADRFQYLGLQESLALGQAYVDAVNASFPVLVQIIRDENGDPLWNRSREQPLLWDMVDPDAPVIMIKEGIPDVRFVRWMNSLDRESVRRDAERVADIAALQARLDLLEA